MDICLGIVPYHHRLLGTGSRSAESIIKEKCTGLICPSILTQNDMVEIFEKTACPEFAVLNLMKTIAADTHLITAVTKIVHQAVSSLNDSGLDSTAGQKIITHLKTIFGSGMESIAQREGTAKTLYNQIVAGDFATGILFPQLMIGLPIGNGESLLGREEAIKGELLKQFVKSDDGIAMRIVERVIEIDEEMSDIFHKDKGYILPRMRSMTQLTLVALMLSAEQEP